MVFITPRPEQVGHAPMGLLKENILGASSSIEMSWSGQVYLSEKSWVSSVSGSIVRTSPPER